MGARPVSIDAADEERVDVGSSQFSHEETVAHRRQLSAQLVGRVSSRRQIDMVQLELKPGLLRQDQMANMDRVKGTPKNTDAPQVEPSSSHHDPNAFS